MTDACLNLTNFLNIDIDIYDKKGVSKFLKALGSKIIVLNNSRNKATFELNISFYSVNDGIKSIHKIIYHPETDIKLLWDRLDYKKLNIGIQSGCSPYAATFHISNKNISLIKELNAEIVLTVYGSQPDRTES